ncbi:hypothetical protein F4775DRAFT_331290 [Biscogniauxia sp. FL1348]|nr:hypothetical protein F4775DRAFT_331290 [Biscogniauxia sp. FL1348]
MHFPQAVPDEFQSLTSRLEIIPPPAGQSHQPRFSRVTLSLILLLALPILQALGESCGLHPFAATCFSLGTVMAFMFLAIYLSMEPSLGGIWSLKLKSKNYVLCSIGLYGHTI